MTYKTAVITGASVGIGREIAITLAQQGLKLVLLSRRLEKLQALQATLAPLTEVHLIASDINDHAKVADAFANLPADFQQIDVLINNAGLARGADCVPAVTWEDWSEMIHTNCLSLAFMTQLLLPAMIANNHGHIINIGSTAGAYAYPGGNVYGATKAFVAQLSLNLKADLLGTAVRVTNIEPGVVDGSEFSLTRYKGDEAKAAAVYANHAPLQPNDIADCVQWALNQPPHVNINRIEVMSVSQAPAGIAVHRT